MKDIFAIVFVCIIAAFLIAIGSLAIQQRDDLRIENAILKQQIQDARQHKLPN